MLRFKPDGTGGFEVYDQGVWIGDLFEYDPDQWMFDWADDDGWLEGYEINATSPAEAKRGVAAVVGDYGR